MYPLPIKIQNQQTFIEVYLRGSFEKIVVWVTKDLIGLLPLFFVVLWLTQFCKKFIRIFRIDIHSTKG
jgi:hypothetical protein